MGFRPSTEELAELIEEIDEDGSGAIEFPEFAQENTQNPRLEFISFKCLGLFFKLDPFRTFLKTFCDVVIQKGRDNETYCRDFLIFYFAI